MHIRIGVFLLRMYIGTNRISKLFSFQMQFWIWLFGHGFVSVKAILSKVYS